MERKGWSARIVLRYAFLQIPFTALLILVLILMRKWVDLPIWLVCGVAALLVVKDIALYPLVWRSYDPDSTTLSNQMEGARGTAVDDLHPTGYVEIGAERWKAEVIGDGPSIRRGQQVRVCGIRGLTLLVQLDTED